MSSTSFRINSPQVIREAFENEVVIVNLETGTYYSLDNIGAFIWSSIEAGANASTIIDALSRHYQNNDQEISREVARFLNELQQEALIVPGQIDNDTAPIVYEAVNGNSFSAPILNKYTDMQELLLLDPIHEVDETGWPSLKR